jgi:Cu2+-exporting ATPase
VFDKTGTLTEGKIQLEEIILASSDYDETSALTIAASLEANSEHPIAKAIISARRDELKTVDKLVHTTGQGIQGRIDETEWFIGNRDFIEQYSASTVADDTDAASKIYLATKQQCVAIFVLSDSIRAEARPLIEQLHAQHKTTYLMSGDRSENANSISDQLGIQHCQANLKPEDKLNNVKALQQQGEIVVMTGDGVNDAPVLAGADLSIAMGKGTQLAAATADMILISNNIEHIYHGYQIAIKTLSIIKQNLSWALLYNVIAIPAAAMGYVEPWLAAIGMSLSSLVVVLNALRLNRIKF